MALRTLELSINSKRFKNTGEALKWAIETFRGGKKVGDRENEEELAKVRLMLTNIEAYGTDNEIKMVFDQRDGSVLHLEAYDAKGKKVGEYGR